MDRYPFPEMSGLPTPPPAAVKARRPSPVLEYPTSFRKSTSTPDLRHSPPRSAEPRPFSTASNIQPLKQANPRAHQRSASTNAIKTLTRTISSSNLLYNTGPPLPPTPSFELVPLGNLIAQSFKDLATLRLLHSYTAQNEPKDMRGSRGMKSSGSLPMISESENDYRTSTLSGRRGYINALNVPVSEASGSASNSKSKGLRRRLSFRSLRRKAEENAGTAQGNTSTSKRTGKGTTDGEAKEIDFDKIEANLKSFEAFYKAWIQSGAANEQNPNGK
jgi:hypothetical protein